MRSSSRAGRRSGSRSPRARAGAPAREPTMPRWPATQTRLPASGSRSSATVSSSPWSRSRAGGARAATSRSSADHLAHQLARTSICVLPAELLAAPWSDRRAAGRPRSGGSSAGRPRPGACRCSASMPFSSTPSPLPGDLACRPRRRPSSTNSRTRVRLAGREHVVVGLVLLQHQPHALDVVARMAPVALRVEVAEVEPLLQAELDRGDARG